MPKMKGTKQLVYLDSDQLKYQPEYFAKLAYRELSRAEFEALKIVPFIIVDKEELENLYQVVDILKPISARRAFVKRRKLMFTPRDMCRYAGHTSQRPNTMIVLRYS